MHLTLRRPGCVEQNWYLRVVVVSLQTPDPHHSVVAAGDDDFLHAVVEARAVHERRVRQQLGRVTRHADRIPAPAEYDVDINLPACLLGGVVGMFEASDLEALRFSNFTWRFRLTTRTE